MFKKKSLNNIFKMKKIISFFTGLKTFDSRKKLKHTNFLSLSRKSIVLNFTEDAVNFSKYVVLLNKYFEIINFFGK